MTADLTVINSVKQLMQLYQKYQHSDTLPLYHAEFLKELTWQLSSIRFHREDYRLEYQSGVEAEVLKTLRAVHQEADGAEDHYDHLRKNLREMQQEVQKAKEALDCYLDLFEENEFFKEFNSIHQQLAECSIRGSLV